MKTIDALLSEGVSGRRVLIRADLNVPLDGTRITDDGRIRAVIPTLTRLRDHGAKVIVCAHLGRPKGVVDSELSLAPVAGRLAELVQTPVAFAVDTVGDSAKAVVSELVDGEIALLENLRFNAAETSKDDAERLAFATELAGLADVYVDDAFGAVHRKHASVYDVATLLPHYGGFLVGNEVSVLRRLTESPDRPYVVVLGGAKVSDKLAVIANLLDKVDRLLIGGGMMFTFLAAKGYNTGTSLLEADHIETCKELIVEAERRGVKLVLPVDTVTADRFDADAEPLTVDVTDIPDNRMGLDIGPKTADRFARELQDAATVFWNGPMGVFEFAAYAAGTDRVARALVGTPAFSVVGGGDSAAAVRLLGVDVAGFSHISTGGGASLEYLEGKTLPGLSVLES